MNIIVCAKQTVDVSEIKIDANNRPQITGIPQKISDFDKNALEEALKIKEKNGGKITVLTIGKSDAKERIKELLAMGADEAVLVIQPEQNDHYTTAHLLACALKKTGDYDLILCGEASIDQFSGQTGPQLAGILDIPQLTYTFNVDATADMITCQRNLGNKTITETSSYPALVTITKEANTPRLPNLMQIMASAQKPIHEYTPSEIDCEQEAKTTQTDLCGITMERKHIILNEDLDSAIGKLIDTLEKEGVINYNGG